MINVNLKFFVCYILCAIHLTSEFLSINVHAVENDPYLASGIFNFSSDYSDSSYSGVQLYLAEFSFLASGVPGISWDICSPDLFSLDFSATYDSMHPTAEPTSQDSFLTPYPSVTSSSTPSVDPTTSRPSGLFTYTPTLSQLGETNSPTEEPTTAPTWTYAQEPTAEPTAQSVADPSFAPTNMEAKTPSSLSTTSPISSSSEAPTAAPSIGTGAYTEDALYSNFSLAIATASSSPLHFSYFAYKGTAVDGTCSDWTNFKSNALTVPLNEVLTELEVSSVSLSAAYRSGEGSPFIGAVACGVKSAAVLIAQGLTGSSPFSVACDGHQWRYVSCNSRREMVLCVDCSPDAQGCLDFPGVVLNPCRQGTSVEVFYSVLQVGLQRRILYPVITAIGLMAGEDSVTVSVDADQVGVVFCAAFIAASGQQLDNVGRVRADGAGDVLIVQPHGVSGSATASIELSGLGPSSRYEVYCFTEDFRANAMPIEVALATRTTFDTKCCRRIVVTSNISSVFEYSSTGPGETLFRFALNAWPQSRVQVTTSLVPQVCSGDGSSSNRSAMAHPSKFIFTNTSESMAGAFVVRGSWGCYKLLLSADKAQFQGAFQLLTILPSTADFPPPSLSKAIFSSDGRKIYVFLNVKSDYGETAIVNYNKAFACSLLLDFIGIGLSKCTWQTASLVTVTLQYSSNDYVQPYDRLTLLSGKLRAFCPSDQTCQSFKFNKISQVIIAKPLSAAYPVAALSTSAQTVSPCSLLVLDPSPSTVKGGSGRPWESISWTVLGTGANLSAVTALLQGYTTNTEEKITIPRELLHLGFVTFRLRVTNFLGRWAVASVTVEIIEEIVADASIFGAGVRSIFVWQRLDLFAHAAFRTCSGNTSSLNSLQLLYDWTAYKELSYQPNLVSSSNDPRAFRLDRYALALYSTYTIVVRVRTADVDSSVSTIYKVKVRTLRSSVLAVIRGGDFFVVSNTGELTLNGSQSMDRDFPHSLETNFQWQCKETSPNFGAPCNVDLTSEKIQRIRSSQLLNYTEAAEDHVYLFTLRVTAYDGLFAVVEATVVVTADYIPTVTFMAVADKYDASSAITIGAAIGSASAIHVQWHSTSLALAGTATTKLTKEVPGDKPITFQLGLRSHSLFPGRTYSFQLLARSPGYGHYRTVAQQSIVINEPPSGGRVDISPLAGYALNTSFFINAAEWDDDIEDFPLRYIILSFAEDPSKPKTLKTATDVPYVTTVLAQGLASMDRIVTCEVIVLDIYDSEGKANVTVAVEPPPADVLFTTLDSQLRQSFVAYDADGVTAIIYSAVETANSANCSQTPDCGSLNRLPCRSTAATCGACKSDDYVGIDGDSNERCIPKEGFRRLLSSAPIVGENCSAGDICASGTCTGGVCMEVDKHCAADCSARGICHFYNIRGNLLTTEDTCSASESFCVAKCDCHDGFFGLDCSLAQAEYDEAVSLRETMCMSLHDVMELQDMSSDVVYSRARLVYDLLQDPTLISAKALASCMGVLTSTVFEFSSLAATPLVSNAVLQALSKVDALGDMLSADSLNELSDAVSILVTERQRLLPVGSDDVFSLSPNIRWVTTKQYGSDMSGAVLMSHLSDYERALRAPDAAWVMFSSDGYDGTASYGVTLIQSVSFAYAVGADNMTGPAAQVEVKDYSGTTIPTQNITVVLSSYRAVVYVSDSVETGVVTCKVSKDGAAFNEMVNCTGSEYLPTSSHSVECPGDEYVSISYACPIYSTFPQCLIFDGSVYSADPACSVESYSSLSVTCTCRVGLGGIRYSLRRRRLVGSGDTAEVRVAPAIAEFVSAFGSYSSLSTSIRGTDASFSNVVAVSFTFVFSTFCFLALAVLMSSGDALDRHTQSDENFCLSVSDFFAAALPTQFSDRNWTSRVAEKLRETHVVLGLLQDHEAVLKFCKLMALMVTVTFVDTLWTLFLFTEGYMDCESRNQKSACVSVKRGQLSFAGGQSACEWHDPTRTCSFQPPTVDVAGVLIMAMLVLLTAIPLNVAVDRSLTTIQNYNTYTKRHGPSYTAKVYTTDSNASRSKALVNKYTSSSSAVETLRSWETTKSKISCYGRLCLMRRRLDRVSISTEVSAVMNTGHHEQLEHHECSFVSFIARRSLPQGGSFLGGSRPWTSRLVAIARSDARAIAMDVDNVIGTDHQQIVALQHFLVYMCVGWKQSLAQQHLTSAGMFDDRRLQTQVTYWCACGFLSSYMVVIAVVVYSYGTVLTLDSSRLWFIAGCVAILQKLVIVDLFFVLVVHVFVAEVLRGDVMRMHHRLRDRGEGILNRPFKKCALPHRRVQSLNAACRWARTHPKYTISRLLLQLNDFDVPNTYASQPPYSSFLCLTLVSVFALLALLPTHCNFIIIEMAIAGISGCILVGLCNLAETSIAIPLAMALAVALAVIPIVYFDLDSDAADEGSRLTKQLSREQKYEVSIEAAEEKDIPVKYFSSPPSGPWSQSHGLLHTAGHAISSLSHPGSPLTVVPLPATDDEVAPKTGEPDRIEMRFLKSPPRQADPPPSPVRSLNITPCTPATTAASPHGFCAVPLPPLRDPPICSLSNIFSTAASLLDSSSSDEETLQPSTHRTVVGPTDQHVVASKTGQAVVTRVSRVRKLEPLRVDDTSKDQPTQRHRKHKSCESGSNKDRIRKR